MQPQMSRVEGTGWEWAGRMVRSRNDRYIWVRSLGTL